MDYNLLKEIFNSFEDNSSKLRETKHKLSTLSADNSFDKNVLTIFKNIHKNIEINESLKRLANTIIEQGDYFSDETIHQSTKHNTLKKILMENNFVESNKLFNLSTLQTYVENILQKQLYEINIKIEENQRALNNLNISSTQKTKKRVAKKVMHKYLLIENEQEKCALKHENIIEILKFANPFPKRHLGESALLYGKICGVNQNHVIKKLHDSDINKRQTLNNANLKLSNNEEKFFAVIVKKENTFSVFFIDYLLYTNPVESQDLGEFIKTSEGKYKIIEV